MFVSRMNDSSYEGDVWDVIAQENIWGFGQVIAVGLLVLPFVSFFGKSYSKFKLREQC
jgi:hypothetical protein